MLDRFNSFLHPIATWSPSILFCPLTTFLKTDKPPGSLGRETHYSMHLLGIMKVRNTRANWHWPFCSCCRTFSTFLRVLLKAQCLTALSCCPGSLVLTGLRLLLGLLGSRLNGGLELKLWFCFCSVSIRVQVWDSKSQQMCTVPCVFPKGCFFAYYLSRL